MANRSSQLRMPGLLACVLAMLACVFLFPSQAQGSWAWGYVQDASGSRTYYNDYYDVPDALNNACGDGKVLVILTNQVFTQPDQLFNIPAGKNVTINLNGKAIRNWYGTLARLNKNSTLTVISRDPETGVDTEKQGALYGSMQQGVYMHEGSHLKLDNVVVKENPKGGIYAEKNCTIDLKNSQITNNSNSGKYGGGICIGGESVKVTLDDSKISNNTAERGGGIYIDGKNADIGLMNGSSIENNTATKAGGGVYCNVSCFTIKSSDGKGTISGNRAEGSSTTTSKRDQSGGGIHVDQKSGTNKGAIEGLTISNNHSEYDGGGIELDQENTTVRNCTITGNTCKYEGGGIYVCNDDNTIDGCTITGNACNVNGEGKNYEGGGVFVWHSYDIGLTGKCVIKGNTRGKDSGNADDVMLRENGGASAKAYITGTLAKGSSVGVRTGITGDRMVAKSFKPESEDCLFADLDGYYISYGSDHDGDAWQRHATKGFELTVNGKSLGRYQNGTSVTVNGASADSNKFFRYWDSDKSAGLNPFADYVADAGNPTVSFKMPQNDVVLVAVYGDKTTAGELTLEGPTAGGDLHTDATFAPKVSGASAAHAIPVELAWYKVIDGGEPLPASGRAEYGAKYLAKVVIDKDQQNGLVFADSVSVTASTGSVKSATVRSDGALEIEIGTFDTEKPTVTSVEGASVTVQEGATEADFRKLLPVTAVARTNAGTAVKLEVDTSKGDLSELIENDAVKKPEGDGTVTVSIPLKSSSEVILPSGKNSVAVTVTVTDAPKTAPEAPTVSPDEGTYSTADDADKFTDGSLKVTASCKTDGARIKYRLDYCDDGWIDDTEEHDYSAATGISLAKRDNDQRLYELEIWSEKDALESEHAFYLYVIDDIQDVTVTVKGTDTGIVPKTETLETHSVRKGKSLTVVAPDRTGYAFEKWIVDGEGKTGSTLTFDSVDEDTTVTAVYNPVVTEIDIDIDAPEPHKFLNQAARTVKATVAGEKVDLTSYLSPNKMGQPTVAWAPAGDDEGKADHTTAYTASLVFKGSSTETGAKYILSDGVTIERGGEVVSDASAYIVEVDGAKRICIEFPRTAGIGNAKVDALDEIELTHEEAWSYQAKQDAGNSDSWGLPKEVSVTSADKGCGCTALLDVTWNKVEGFNKSDYDEQTLTVTGTVDYPDYVAPAGDSDKTVTATIKVAKAETVGAPQASIPSGAYKGTQDVAFVCETDDVAIRYTTDGSEPTEESPAYDGGWIEVAESTSFKVKAFRDGWKPSETLELAYKIVHDVTFDAAGGSAVRAQEVEHGKPATRPADPVLAGCAFEGWYAEGAEDAYDFDTPVTADLELHARWSAKGEPVELHAVTFDPAGGSEVPEQHVAHGGCATRPADPELDGFRFEGWLTADGEEYDFSSKVTSDVALHAAWSRGGEIVTAHMVTFDSAGGSAVDPQTVADGAKAKDPGAPTLAGFVFAGWATADGELYDFDSKVTGDLVLYARWAANGEEALAHLVTFDANGGGRVAAQTVTDGNLAVEPEAPTRAGYDFAGWTLDGAPYDFSTPVKSDLELKAAWKAKESEKDDPDKEDGRSDADGEDDADKENGKKDDKSDADGKLAATGDRTLLIVGLLVALGLLAAAAGIAAKRRKK